MRHRTSASWRLPQFSIAHGGCVIYGAVLVRSLLHGETSGSNPALPGTTVAAEPQLAGVIIVDDLIPFSFPIASGGNILGDVQVRIVRSDLDSTLDFY